VESLLQLLGIESLQHLDVLVFLYRHHSSLTSADQIARLLGYETKAVINAVHTLESSGLVKRSRVSQGTRLYEVLVPEDSPKRDAFSQLMSLAGTRAGRLLVLNVLCNSKTGQGTVQPLFGEREGMPDG
jgi:predicted transcriptional regulator